MTGVPDEPPRIIGRADAQRRLGALFDAAVDGRGGAIVVRGEPGIGKSALLHSAESRDDVAVVRVDCLPRWRHGRRNQSADALGGPSAAATSGDPPTNLTERLRGTAPIALVIDDLHWLDDASLAALNEASAHLRGMAAAVVVSVRDHDVPTTVIDVLARLSADRVLAEVRLQPVDPAAAETVAIELLGVPLSAALAADVALAGGNPLHIVDICQARRAGVGDDSPPPADAFDDPAGSFDAGSAAGHGDILDGLSADARCVLSVAALLGTEFEVRELCAVVGRSMTDLLPAVREALDNDFVGEGGDSRLVFQRAQTRAALIATLPAAVRAELHRDIAAALHSIGTPTPRVAVHLSRGSLHPSDLEWVRSMTAPTVAADPDPAVALWTRMRAAVPDADRRSPAVDAELARALLARGDLRLAEVLSRRVLARPLPPGAEGSLRVTMATTLMRQGRWVAVKALGEAGAAAPTLHLGERAEQLAIAATAALAAGDADAAVEAADRADRAAERAGVDRVRGYTAGVRGHVEHRAGRLSEAEGLLTEAVAARAVDGPVGDGTTRVWLALALADMDRLDDADRVLDEAEEACRGGATGRVEILRARAGLRLDAGLILDAIEILDRLPAPVGAVSSPEAVVLARRALAGLYSDGRRGDDRWAARLVAEGMSAHGCYGSAWIGRAVAARRALDGDADGERQALATGWAACRDHGLIIDLVILGPHLAATAASAGQHDEAAAAADTVADIASHNPSVVTIQAAANVTGAFASQDPDGLVRAARMWQDSPRRLEAVRVAKRVADALIRLGHPLFAETVSAESSRAYMAQGARLNADRLQKSSGEPATRRARRRQRRATAGSAALTRAERIVAEHVERGESNAEIAARLVLSRRTVETHVSNILAKLDMRSRSDLIIAAAARHVPRRDDHTG